MTSAMTGVDPIEPAPAPLSVAEGADVPPEVHEQLRLRAREIAGLEVDGERDERVSFREVLRQERATIYPLAALIALSASQSLGSAGFDSLYPEIARTLGFGVTFAAVISLVGQITALLVPMATSYLVRDRPVRASVTVVSAVAWSIGVIGVGFIPTAMLFVAYTIVDVSTSSVNDTVSGSLTMDLYPPRVRVRAMAMLSSADSIASVVMPLSVAFLSSVVGLTWRGVFVVVGVGSVLLVVVAVRLRDPGYGHYDRLHLRDAVRETVADLGEDVPDEVPAPQHASFLEVYRSLWANRTMRLSLISSAVSSTSAPLGIAIAFYLADALSFSSGQLAILNAASSAAALLGLWTLAPFGDRLFRRSPRALYWVSSGLSVLGSASVLANVYLATPFWAYVFSILTALLGAFVGPASMVGGMTVVPPEHRHYCGSVFLLAGLLGAAAGTGVFAGTSQQAGLMASIVALVVITTIGAVIAGFAGDSFLDVLDEGNERYIEDELVRVRTAAGHPPPLLECRGLQVSYGSLQVLHDVDVTLHEGELLALLGLNGSGKSTLLRTIAGILPPDAGSVRYLGRDITHASVQKRVHSGIALMPGGRAVFPALTVSDNLRAAAVRDKGAQRRHAVDEVLDRFPALQPLLHRRARLLSGGEAQMLGLARAFLMRPDLLMIDELTLGLAPRVVGELMEHLRELHRSGTSIILVEQSINVASQLAERAIFLDRGLIRFDGPIEQLRGRDDLLRAIFFRESLA